MSETTLATRLGVLDALTNVIDPELGTDLGELSRPEMPRPPELPSPPRPSGDCRAAGTRPSTAGARWLAVVAAVALVLAVAIALLAPASAWAGALTPESGGSPNADEIHTLYVIALSAALTVLGGVVATLGYSLVRFRARKGRVAPQIHGNTRLEIGWTLAAFGLVVALTVVTLIFLPEIRDPGAGGGAQVSAGGTAYTAVAQPAPPAGRALRIAVSGQQFIWRFTYRRFLSVIATSCWR